MTIKSEYDYYEDVKNENDPKTVIDVNKVDRKTHAIVQIDDSELPRSVMDAINKEPGSQ